MNRPTGIISPTKNDLTIKSQELISKGYFKVERITYECTRQDGKPSGDVVREIVKRGDLRDAVHLSMYDPELDAFCLVRQLRPGMMDDKNPYSLEVVAGMVDADEIPEQAAVREASEETGVTINEARMYRIYNHPIQMCSGMTHERTTLMGAHVDLRNTNQFGGVASENEDIEIFVVKSTKVKELIKDGHIRDMPSIAALQAELFNLGK